MFFAPEFGYFAFARFIYPGLGAVGGDLGKTPEHFFSSPFGVTFL